MRTSLLNQTNFVLLNRLKVFLSEPSGFRNYPVIPAAKSSLLPASYFVSATSLILQLAS